VRWAKEAGCTISVDKMGNVFARRAGRDDSLTPVITGSHADSQPTGGKFDGIYGVLGGLEVIRSLNDHGIETDRPIEVVIWTNEEGSRFAPAMVSSGVFAGVFTLDYGLSRADVDGKTMGEELARIGYAGDQPMGKPIHAAFELHIEQGPILEAEGKTIGVVTHAQGQRWYEVVFTGQESHAGPTPMPRRKDALVGAARMIDLVNRIGHAHAPFACATVGMLQVHPNSRNVIPGRVFFTIDIRHPEDEVLAKMDEEVREGIARIAEETRLEVTRFEQIFYYKPVAFDEDCVASVRAAAQRFGYSHRDMVSGAGHDACYLAQVAPTSMVFVPCIDGISHNEIEDATPEWIEAGCNVLLHAMLGRAAR
jgi:N-carbamoyl-L-amino-acid hydrolase